MVDYNINMRESDMLQRSNILVILELLTFFGYLTLGDWIGMVPAVMKLLVSIRLVKNSNRMKWDSMIKNQTA